MAYRSSGASKATLFLGDLSSVCTEEDIEKLFCQYGKIRHIRIQRSPGSYSSLGYGFIRMGNNSESLRAKEELDGVLLCGRRIRVREAAFGVGGDSGGAKPPPKNSLFVRFMGLDRHAFTNEEKIREIYSKLGPISDVSIRESKFDKKTGIQKGYGFVHFDESGDQGSEGVEAALTAVTAVPKVVVDQVFYACEVSRNLQAQLTGEVAGAGNSRGRNSNNGNGNGNGGSFFPGGGGGMSAEYPDGYSVNSRNNERARGGQSQAPQQVLVRQHQMDGGAIAEPGHSIHLSGSSSYDAQDDVFPTAFSFSGSGSQSVGSGRSTHSNNSGDISNISSNNNSQNYSLRSSGSGGSSHHILPSGNSSYTQQLQQLQQLQMQQQQQQQQYGAPVTFPQRPPAVHSGADAGEYRGNGGMFANRDGNRFSNGPQEAPSGAPLSNDPAALLSFLQANGKLPPQRDQSGGSGSNYNRSGRNDEGNFSGGRRNGSASGNGGRSGAGSGGGTGWFTSQRQAAAAANQAQGSNQRQSQNPIPGSDYQHQLQQHQQQLYPNASAPPQMQQRPFNGGYQPAYFAGQQRQQQRHVQPPHGHQDEYNRSGERVSDIDRQQEAFLQQQIHMQNQFLLSRQDGNGGGGMPPMNTDNGYAQQNGYHQPPPPPQQQQQHSALRYENNRNGTDFNINTGNFFPQALSMPADYPPSNGGSSHVSERGWTDPISQQSSGSTTASPTSTSEGRSFRSNASATTFSLLPEASGASSIMYASNEVSAPSGGQQQQQQQQHYMNQGFVVQDSGNAEGGNQSCSVTDSRPSSTEDAADGDTQITQMLDNMAAMVLKQRNEGDGTTDSGGSDDGEVAFSSVQNVASSVLTENAESADKNGKNSHCEA